MDQVMDISSFLTLAAISLTAVAIYYHFKVFSFWSSRGINGPTPWPFLGTNVYYIFDNKVDLESKWHQKYGPTVGVYDGYWPTLRTIDNEIIKQVWIKDFSSYSDRANMFIHGHIIKKWLFWSPGKIWTNQRALIAPMFTSVKMRSMLGLIKDCSEDLNSEITKKLDTSTQKLANGLSKQNGINKSHICAEESSTLISKDDLMAYNLDVVARSLFGMKLNVYQDKSSEFAKRAFAFSKFPVLRFIVWLFIPHQISRLLKFDLVSYSDYEYFDKLTASVLKERRQKVAANQSSTVTTNQNDFIGMLMDAKIPEKYKNVYTKEDESDLHYNDNIAREELEAQQKDQTTKSTYFRSFSDLEIRGQTTFLFLAGFETTSSTITFCLYELAHLQKEQEEVYQEIVDVFKGRSFKEIGLDDIIALKKLDAFLSESLRLHSPVTENNRVVSNKSGTTLFIDGRQVSLPHKTIIAHNGFILQRHEDYWPNATQFDMSRFYRENRDQIRTCTYAPFGLGPRNCAGMRFALLNVRFFLAHMIYNYRLYPGPSSKQYPPSYNKHAFFLQLTNSDIRVEPRTLTSAQQSE